MSLLEKFILNAAKKMTAEYFNKIKDNTIALVQPYLAAIYENTDPGDKIDQVGSGFFAAYENCPILITAKHVLYGHSGNEDPSEKLIFVAGKLEKIGDISSKEP
jgi:hypothetical protein